MDNIRERKGKNGQVTYQVCVTQSGVRTVKSFSSRKYGSKKTALEYAKAFRNRASLGEIFKEKPVVLDELYETMFELFPKSLETQDRWKSSYTCYIQKDYGDVPITEITPSDIQLCLNKMISTCSDDKIGRVFTLWRSLFKAAILKKYVNEDMTMRVIKPKSDRVQIPRDQVLDEGVFWETVETLLSGSFDYKKIGYALQIMYYTGARPSEVYALTADDVDRIDKTITINKAIGATTTRSVTVKRTKNPNSIRTIPYNAKLDEIWDVLPKDGYLLLRENGKFLNADCVSPILKRISGGRLRSYTLRHNFSTTLLKDQVDLRTIQELMGHKSSAMTLEYARSDKKRMAEAVKCL